MQNSTPDENIESFYLMEHAGEGSRLKQKTQPRRVLAQAKWAGLLPGMRLLDVGCGSGAATSVLGAYCGNATGIDASQARIEMARSHYSHCEFKTIDINENIEPLGTYDFIWVRFFLEYHREEASEIIKKLRTVLSPEGILCCIDLDHNCLNHYPLPESFERELSGCIEYLQKHMNWDPYIGRKMYTYFYDHGLEDINVSIDAHHCIYGELSEVDSMNWFSKIDVAIKNSGYTFPEYAGDYSRFRGDAEAFFTSPRRFTYTPLIMVRGKKPS